MNETSKTIAFAAVALALLAAASLANWLPDRRGPGAPFREQGQPFFPEFVEAVDEDPLAARVLQVVEWDDDLAVASRLQVQFDDGQWTIPSHHGYPADAADRMARLAGQVAQLEMEALRSDRLADHEELGVVDPLDETVATLEGRGTRVTLRPAPGGEALADFIIGDRVPGRPGLRYVRLPGKNRVYTAEVDLDLSTRFADWIDADLIDVQPSEAERLVYDTQTFEASPVLERGALTTLFELRDGETITLEKTVENGQDAWTMEGLGPDQQIDRTVVEEAIRAVDRLQIAGVRPLPTTPRLLNASLVSRGFYVPLEGDLVSINDEVARLGPDLEFGGSRVPIRGALVGMGGSTRLATDSGIVYTLHFGDVTLATGEALTAGTGEDEDASAESESEPGQPGDAPDAGDEEEPEAEEERDPESQTESRFVLIDVSFDPGLLPEDEDEPTGEAQIPEDPFARAPDDPERVEAERAAAEEAEREEQERQRRIEEGQETVADLRSEFGRWYYVVPADDYRAIMPGRDALVLEPGEEPRAEEPPPPSFDPGMMLDDPHRGLNIPGLGAPPG